MGYYRTCPYCGANLDPGEKCDCRDDENLNKEDIERTHGGNRKLPAGMEKKATQQGAEKQPVVSPFAQKKEAPENGKVEEEA